MKLSMPEVHLIQMYGRHFHGCIVSILRNQMGSSHLNIPIHINHIIAKITTIWMQGPAHYLQSKLNKTENLIQLGFFILNKIL